MQEGAGHQRPEPEILSPWLQICNDWITLYGTSKYLNDRLCSVCIKNTCCIFWTLVVPPLRLSICNGYQESKARCQSTCLPSTVNLILAYSPPGSRHHLWPTVLVPFPFIFWPSCATMSWWLQRIQAHFSHLQPNVEARSSSKKGPSIWEAGKLYIIQRMESAVLDYILSELRSGWSPEPAPPWFFQKNQSIKSRYVFNLGRTMEGPYLWLFHKVDEVIIVFKV